MTPLRQQMIRELELERKSPKTIEAYVTAVAQLAAYYRRSPEQLTLGEVRDYIHHLVTERKLAYSSCNQKLAGLKFFYQRVLGRKELDLRVPAKRSGRLPEPFSREEVARLLQAAEYNPKHRMLLMTGYATGLRLSELVHLELADIHSERMLVRVNQGKGRKDRYTLLSPRLLSELRDYWRLCRPARWLFSGRLPSEPLTDGSAQRAFYKAEAARPADSRPWHPYATALVRFASAGRGRRPADLAAIVGPHQPHHDGHLPACNRKASWWCREPTRLVAVARTGGVVRHGRRMPACGVGKTEGATGGRVSRPWPGVCPDALPDHCTAEGDAGDCRVPHRGAGWAAGVVPAVRLFPLSLP